MKKTFSILLSLLLTVQIFAVNVNAEVTRNDSEAALATAKAEFLDGLNTELAKVVDQVFAQRKKLLSGSNTGTLNFDLSFAHSEADTGKVRVQLDYAFASDKLKDITEKSTLKELLQKLEGSLKLKFVQTSNITEDNMSLTAEALVKNGVAYFQLGELILPDAEKVECTQWQIEQGLCSSGPASWLKELQAKGWQKFSFAEKLAAEFGGGASLEDLAEGFAEELITKQNLSVLNYFVEPSGADQHLVKDLLQEYLMTVWGDTAVLTLVAQQGDVAELQFNADNIRALALAHIDYLEQKYTTIRAVIKRVSPFGVLAITAPELSDADFAEVRNEISSESIDFSPVEFTARFAGDKLQNLNFKKTWQEQISDWGCAENLKATEEDPYMDCNWVEKHKTKNQHLNITYYFGETGKFLTSGLDLLYATRMVGDFKPNLLRLKLKGAEQDLRQAILSFEHYDFDANHVAQNSNAVGNLNLWINTGNSKLAKAKGFLRAREDSGGLLPENLSLKLGFEAPTETDTTFSLDGMIGVEEAGKFSLRSIGEKFKNTTQASFGYRDMQAAFQSNFIGKHDSVSVSIPAAALAAPEWDDGNVAEPTELESCSEWDTVQGLCDPVIELDENGQIMFPTPGYGNVVE